MDGALALARQIGLPSRSPSPYTAPEIIRFRGPSPSRNPLPQAVVYAEAMRFAKFALVGPQESVSSLRELILPISTLGAKRRSTRIADIVPLVVRWDDSQARTIVEETATVSINCHGFQYFSKRRPQKNTSITFHISGNRKNSHAAPMAYSGRVAWARKSRRLDGLHLVAIELEIPLNIWDADEVPKDWAAFSQPSGQDPDTFLAEVDRILLSARATNYYQLLEVKPDTPRSELKRHFYQLARRFRPDHHMDRPEWTPRLVALMEELTTAYKTLSDDKAKKEYDSLLAPPFKEESPDARKRTQGYLDKAQACMVEKNFTGCILWLHRAIESEPNSSSHRAMLGQCLSTFPEYRREAVEQFEIAIELDPRNLTAHLHYGELLEQLRVPWRARVCYLRVLELDTNHRGARERLNRLSAAMPRAASRLSLLGRLAGRR